MSSKKYFIEWENPMVEKIMKSHRQTEVHVIMKYAVCWLIVNDEDVKNRFTGINFTAIGGLVGKHRTSIYDCLVVADDLIFTKDKYFFWCLDILKQELLNSKFHCGEYARTA